MKKYKTIDEEFEEALEESNMGELKIKEEKDNKPVLFLKNLPAKTLFRYASLYVDTDVHMLAMHEEGRIMMGVNLKTGIIYKLDEMLDAEVVTLDGILTVS